MMNRFEVKTFALATIWLALVLPARAMDDPASSPFRFYLDVGSVGVSRPGGAADRDGWAGRTNVAGRLNASGLGLDVGLVILADPAADRPFEIEFSASFFSTNAVSRQTKPLSGRNSVALSVGPVPDAALALSVSAGGKGAAAFASLSVTDTKGDTASVVSNTFSPVGSGNRTTVEAYSPATTGALFVALATNGGNRTATSLGALTDGRGFRLVGIGNLNGARMVTVDRSGIDSARAGIMVGYPGALEEDLSLKPRIGFTIEHFGDWREVSRSVDLSRLTTGSGLSSVGVQTRDRIDTTLLAPLVGLVASRPVGSGLVATLGVDAGLGGYQAKRTRHVRALLPGSDLEPIDAKGGRDSGVAGVAAVTGGLDYRANDRLKVQVFGSMRFYAGLPSLRSGSTTSRIGHSNLIGRSVGLRLSMDF